MYEIVQSFMKFIIFLSKNNFRHIPDVGLNTITFL